MYGLGDDASDYRVDISLNTCDWLPPSNKPGYHINKIPKGTLGESSKILEEVLELQDAEEQDCKIMQLVELSDLIGAIEEYLRKKFHTVTLQDLIKMSSVTRRAFVNGYRK